jgi:23S rRNA (adenine2503-C2)-methyltransferase
MDLSPRRITVSTCGLIRGIRDLACSGLKPRLAISLGSAIEAKRKKLIPFARGNNLDQLRKALVFYREKTKRRITIEYTLLRELNDTDEDAQALASFARSTRSHVNLIRYNPMPPHKPRRATGSVSQRKLFPPQTERVRSFTQILVDRKVEVSERYRRGSDINAACGQLLFTEQ